MSRFASFLRTAGMIAALALVAWPASAQPSNKQSAVLVTGASSGIGRKIAELLASKGHFVYAGARRQDDIDALSRIPNMQGIRLDVTSPSEIAAAVQTIRGAGRGLHDLVNNAGVAILAPLIEVDEKELSWLFDVNVYGPYRVTKAFAPLLIESKGRITTVGSISGILSGPLFGPYSMSKHAVEAFTDALGAELARFDIKVSVIEPGNYRSEIGRNTVAQVEAAAERYPGSPYQEQMRNMVKVMGAYETYPEPDAVAEAALHALFDPNPKVRYMVVPAARQAEVTIRKAIDELVQLNQGHQFSYDRETLIRMLDSSLARHK